jgi:Spy/CpxP family protein refolding chaperone
MKRNLVITVLLTAALVGGGAGAVSAGYGTRGDFGGPPPGMELGPGSFDGRKAKALKLTDTQHSQIKTILDAERELFKPLIDKINENRKLLTQAAEASTFDEAAVRAIAVEQATIETELIVSRTKVQCQIYILLTAEQRELLKNLRPEPPSGSDK